MSKLNSAFHYAVMKDVIAREEKLQIVSNGLIEIFKYMEIHPVEAYHRLIRCKFDELNGIFQNHDFISLMLYNGPSENHRSEDDTQLEIVLSSSGRAKIYFSGIEFNKMIEGKITPEIYEFDMDSYTASDVVAKILTIIQDADGEEFGPHVTATLQKIWTEEMGKFANQGPGQVPIV